MTCLWEPFWFSQCKHQWNLWLIRQCPTNLSRPAHSTVVCWLYLCLLNLPLPAQYVSTSALCCCLHILPLQRPVPTLITSIKLGIHTCNALMGIYGHVYSDWRLWWIQEMKLDGKDSRPQFLLAVAINYPLTRALTVVHVKSARICLMALACCPRVWKCPS